MTSLRSSVIRVAYSLPQKSPERNALLRILKEAGQDWDVVVAGDRVRVRVLDHPENQLQVQELPGKPFRARLRRCTYDTKYFVISLHPGGPFLMTNIVNDANLSASMSFDQVTAAMDKALEQAKASVLENEAYYKYKESHPGIYPLYTESFFRDRGFPHSLVRNEEVNFQEIEPVNYKAVQFKGRDFNGIAKWGEFTFYPDAVDEYMSRMEGMQAFYKSTAAAGARKLFKLIKADPDILSQMSLKSFEEFLRKNKIGYNYVPTVWR